MQTCLVIDGIYNRRFSHTKTHFFLCATQGEDAEDDSEEEALNQTNSGPYSRHLRSTTVNFPDAVYKPRKVLPIEPAKGLRWIAENLGKISDTLSEAGAKVLRALVPFKKIMEIAKVVQVVFDHVENIARICLKAVGAAALIPKAGAPFIPVADVMGKIVPVMTTVDAKFTLFMKTIGTFWSLSIGPVEMVIASFDGGIVQYATMGAEIAADVKESQCTRSLTKSLAGGVDILGGIEVGFFFRFCPFSFLSVVSCSYHLEAINLSTCG